MHLHRTKMFKERQIDFLSESGREMHKLALSLQDAKKTSSWKRNYTPTEVQRQLDPFLVEARAFEHIKRHCPDSYKVSFPQYFGVLTGIPRKKYPSSCMLRRRAVVLETILPEWWLCG